MDESTFLKTFADIIQSDDPINMDSQLSEIEDWDSMAVMAVIAHLDIHYSKQVTFNEFAHMNKVADIYKLFI